MKLQEFIHNMEMGAGGRALQLVVAVVAMAAMAVFYDLAAFKNLATEEGMDAAQLARNISQGRGYTTHFVRPLSVYFVQRQAERGLERLYHGLSVENQRLFTNWVELRRRESTNPAPAQLENFLKKREQWNKVAFLASPHPDLANAPVYPVLLAVLLKCMPFEYDTGPGKFNVYKPDLWIAMFNQALLLVAVWQVFFLSRRWFDAAVAWVSAGLMLTAELLWRFSVAGLSTLLLLVIFLGLVSVLARLEHGAREGGRDARWQVKMALLAGVLVGAGALTRYSIGWLILPVLGFLLWHLGQNRALLAAAALGAFVLVMAPWVARNYAASGTPFGTAGFAVCQNTTAYPENQLDRTLKPEFSRVEPFQYVLKFLAGTREMVGNDLPRLGGSWVTAFFLVGLLVPFRNPTLGRLRSFVMLCVVLLMVVQAMGRTHLTTDMPEVNSENLLVLALPMVLIFGVSLFFVLLEQFQFPYVAIRYAVIGLFGVVASVPLLLVFLPPPSSPIAYPPYWPPDVQRTARWMKESELIMSDIPWAVGWYGRRQCVWLTLDADKDFYTVHDTVKPVQALYLTPKTLKTLDTAAMSRVMRDDIRSWEAFTASLFLKQEVPTGFPLRKAFGELLPEQLFLTDKARWSSSGE
ncbi:MAG TPA: glycosyltransferase family 39 protein [Verrucomicrobiae bacterium]